MIISAMNDVVSSVTLHASFRCAWGLTRATTECLVFLIVQGEGNIYIALRRNANEDNGYELIRLLLACLWKI